MDLAICLFALILFDLCSGQTDDPDPENRKFHKHKKRRPPQQYGAPCYGGYGRENDDQDSRSLFAALGGAAVGYHVGTKYPKQPIIYNNIYNQYPGGGGGIGNPCLSNSVGPGSLGGLFGNHHGGLLGNHGGLGGYHGIHGGHSPILSSHFGGGHFGGHRQTVNWDRTIRQFERNVVKPISKWFK